METDITAEDRKGENLVKYLIILVVEKGVNVSKTGFSKMKRGELFI